MKLRFLVLPFLALAGFAFAGEPAPAPRERLQQFLKDLPLIEVLVQEGISLAGEEDPLKRAQTCNVLAKTLVTEIQQAAGHKDEGRAASLGNYLQAVLVRGVAGNLDLARTTAPQGASRAPEMKLISDQVLEVTQPVADSSPESKIMQPAAQAVNTGRVAVEKALHGKGRDKKN